MSDTLDKAPADIMNIGIDIYSPDFSPVVDLDTTTSNVSSGVNRGVGPRYGISPIPRHSHNETLAAPNYVGLMGAETNASSQKGFHLLKRHKVYGVVPLALRTFSDLTVTRLHYAWIIGGRSTAIATDTAIDVCLSSNGVNGTPGLAKYEGDLCAGLPQETIGNAKSSFHMLGASSSSAWIIDPANAINWLGFDSLSVAGSDIPAEWLMGVALTVPDATHSAAPTFYEDAGGPSGSLGTLICGSPSDQQLNNFAVGTRSFIFYNYSTTKLEATYTYNITAVDKTFFQSVYPSDTLPKASVAFGANTSTAVNNKRANGLNYANVQFVVLYAPGSVTNSSYNAVFIAAKIPYIVLFQEWRRVPGNGQMNQWFNPVLDRFYPRAIQTKNEGGTNYTENTDQKLACWQYWPDFIDGTSVGDEAGAAYNGSIHVRLGAAATGILRKNTIYEFAFSVFDKQTGHESNVGPATKLQTGNNDFVRLSLYRDSQTAGVFNQTPPSSVARHPLPTMYDSVASTSPAINFLQFRIYYRPLGAFEWLPAGQFDFAKMFGDPNMQTLWICQGDIAGSTGGQPGAYNDYSPLPQDSYFDVKTFNNRVFWCSSKGVTWSKYKDPFSYPARNNVACPSGAFKGLLAHNYLGQSVRQGRLLIFGSEAIYTGRYTGVLQDMAVQVSSTATAQFPIEGSDFIVDFWTSFTAFSSRAAVVAEGIVYYWGPKGVFVDLGNSVPDRVSIPLEPWIFKAYDPQQTDDIHALYNSSTKDIIWFYSPAEDTTKTHALFYNIITKKFLRGKFNGRVDASQGLSIINGTSSRPTGGQRAIIFSRVDSSTDVQRAFFLDERNRSGDIFPKTEMLVKSFTSPTTSTRRLTLATGFDSTNFATIAAGDLICLQQLKDYATSLTNGDNLIATVASINAGAGTLDINIPSTASIDATASFSDDRLYFPIWHSTAAGVGLNGFSWTMPSRYWLPNGVDMWGYWLYMYVLAKLNLYPSINAQTFSLAYRTPISSGTVTDTITLSNNSDGAFQLLHPLSVGNQNMEGQALKFTISGVQIGSELVLQYLQGHIQQLDGFQLKIFEG